MNKNAILPVLTGGALLLLVALPVTFVLLQAIFPHLDSGAFSAPFSAFVNLFNNTQFPILLGGTLKLGLGVALGSALVGIPLGTLRGLFALPAAALWDALFLIPFLFPPYLAALSWMLALQSHGYVQQLLLVDLNNFCFHCREWCL